MTETDITRRPLTMPERFIPYLEKYRLYKLFKDMVRDLVVNLPRDHLKHMKVFLTRHHHINKDTNRVLLLCSPELHFGSIYAGVSVIALYGQCRPSLMRVHVSPFDIKELVKYILRDLECIVITRRCIMDRYEKHDDFEPGCVSPVLMSGVTKYLTLKEPVTTSGWLMFDHPCTVREARCLQVDGVLPTVTLVLKPTPLQAPPTESSQTPSRSFFQQDFEGLQFVYKATLKEVFIDPEDGMEKISLKCYNAIRACMGGAQGPGQGHHVIGAPGVYRVLLLGPWGAGCKTQARLLARHMGLVYLTFEEICREAKERTDAMGEKLRLYGASLQLKAEMIKRRLQKKDCIDNGWVLTGYPKSGLDFEKLDTMHTPPNRVIFLNADWATCKARVMSVAVDWCTGGRAAPGSGPRVIPYPGRTETDIDYELDNYFSEAVAELRAAAGISAEEISAIESIEEVQVKIQAVVMAAPAYNIEFNTRRLRNVRGE